MLLLNDPPKMVHRSTITLNQGNPNVFGIPEFFAKSRFGVGNGAIYEVVGDTRVKVGIIGPDGIITLFKN